MSTTPTQGKQAFSIDSNGVSPSNAAPYPTEVGTATTDAIGQVNHAHAVCR